MAGRGQKMSGGGAAREKRRDNERNGISVRLVVCSTQMTYNVIPFYRRAFTFSDNLLSPLSTDIIECTEWWAVMQIN